jgi:hypothetical protein
MGLVNLSSILVSDIAYRNVLWKAMNRLLILMHFLSLRKSLFRLFFTLVNEI